MLIWAFIGLGYPLYNAFLPYIQATRGAQFGDGSTYLTYRNSLIISVLGIPGALLGGLLVEIPRFGRKGTLALSTVATGAFLYASTTALDSASLLGWNCAFNFTSNVMYAVLYAYTPEIFPTKDRGTGNALTACSNRIFGIMAVSYLKIPFFLLTAFLVPELEVECVQGVLFMSILTVVNSRSSPCSRIWKRQLRSTPAEHCSLLLGFWSSFSLSSHRERQVYDWIERGKRMVGVQVKKSIIISSSKKSTCLTIPSCELPQPFPFPSSNLHNIHPRLM
jgi:MFS family permease